MHQWGDKDFDWEGLDQVVRYVDKRLKRWRIDVRQTKEKFGCLRCYCSLGVQMFHQLIWPGYSYNQYPWHWLWRLDISLHWIWPVLNRIILPIHCRVYRTTYRKAVKRWPHLRKEILCCADWPELLDESIPRPKGMFLFKF